MKKLIIPTLFSVILLALSSPAQAQIKLESNGFGPIRLGSVISKLPKSADGIYDCIDKVVISAEMSMDDFDTIEYHIKSKGEDIAILTEFEGKIYSMDIVSTKLVSPSGLSLNTTASQLLDKGAKTHCDNSGYVGLVINGFLFRDMDLSKSGQKKAEIAYLDGSDQVFNKTDYVSGTKPKRITIAEWYR